MLNPLRYRQVHLDFHTSPNIPGIGEAFDASQWVQTLKQGHVDSITLFATCHHGYSYFNTQVGERHPNLKFDLLRKQFDATKGANINAPIYLTAGVNNWAADNRPEWREVNVDGAYMGWSSKPTMAGFRKMCFNTPYLDLLCEQINEVVHKFPNCDGIFLDIIQQGPCCCRWCMKSMAAAGFDPMLENDRLKHSKIVLLNYYKATTAAAKIDNANMPVFHNSGHIAKGQTDILQYFSHLELESLPTGGWGYDHFPMSARYTAQLPYDVLGMTGKFHTTWGEFGGYKHPNALRYECAAMVAHGTKCSIGDQLHPSGKLDESTYGLIGAAYAEVEKKEPYCNNAVNVADIGLISSAAIHQGRAHDSSPDTGAGRVLLEGHFLFNVLDADMDFMPYKLIILPDNITVNDTLKKKIDHYLAQGGKLLITGDSGLNEERTASLFDIGATLHGPSEFEPDYVLPIKKFQPEFCASPLVMYRRANRLKVTTGQSLGDVYDPYFNRSYKHFCSHQHTPPKIEASGFHMGVQHGNITYLAHPVFTLYTGYGSVAYRHIITSVINNILRDTKTLSTNLPSMARVTLTYQPKQNRHVLHLLYANTIQRGGKINNAGGTTRNTQPIEIIEELIPLNDVTVELRNLNTAESASAPLSASAVTTTLKPKSLSINLNRLKMHEIIVIENGLIC